MINNDGAVPGVGTYARSDRGNRGFNLLLLSAGGRPTHFLKCRPRDDAALERETALLRRLWQDPTLRAHLPEVYGISGNGIQVQVARHLDGDLYSRLISRLSVAEWRASLHAIAATVSHITRSATALLPDLLSPGASIDLHAAGASLLAALQPAGLDPARAELLAAALRRAGCLPRALQHGDLWPANVLRDQQTWRLLDFEFFGLVQAPLYDVCHLLQTSVNFRVTRGHGTTAPWMKGLAAGDPPAIAARAVLREAAESAGLSVPQVVGAVVFYTIDIAVRLYRRGRSPQEWLSLVRDTCSIADLLGGGSDVAMMLAPGAA